MLIALYDQLCSSLFERICRVEVQHVSSSTVPSETKINRTRLTNFKYIEENVSVPVTWLELPIT